MLLVMLCRKSTMDSSSISTPLRRSSRHKLNPLAVEKRRVIAKPKRILDNSDLKQVRSYYLDKRVKRLPPSLETIFEEPKQAENDDTVKIMSARKFNRSLNFDKSPTEQKLRVKKRQLKARKHFSWKKKSKKVTIDLLMKTLSIIEGENMENFPSVEQLNYVTPPTNGPEEILLDSNTN